MLHMYTNTFEELGYKIVIKCKLYVIHLKNDNDNDGALVVYLRSIQRRKAVDAACGLQPPSQIPEHANLLQILRQVPFTSRAAWVKMCIHGQGCKELDALSAIKSCSIHGGASHIYKER